MELYKRIVEIFEANIIYCLIPILLTLIIVEIIFKNRFETKKALKLISRTIILYTIITGTVYIINLLTTKNPEQFAIYNRATGIYAWAFWLMFLLALILPFTLFIKKLASKFWYVLIVAFAIKSGFYFERFAIIITSIHRDYLSKNANTNTLTYGIGIIVIQGIIITIITLGVFEILKRKKNDRIKRL